MNNISKTTLDVSFMRTVITAFQSIVSTLVSSDNLITVYTFLGKILIGTTIFTGEKADENSDIIHADKFVFNIKGSMISIYRIHLFKNGEPVQNILIIEPGFIECFQIIDGSSMSLRNSLGIKLLKDVLKAVEFKSIHTPNTSFIDYTHDDSMRYINALRDFNARLMHNDQSIDLVDHQRTTTLEYTLFNSLIQDIRHGCFSNFAKKQFANLFSIFDKESTVSGIICSNDKPERNYAIVTRVFLQDKMESVGHYVYLIHCLKAGAGSLAPYFLYNHLEYAQKKLSDTFDFYPNTKEAFQTMLKTAMINSRQKSSDEGFRVKREPTEQWLRCLEAERRDRDIKEKQQTTKKNNLDLCEYILKVFNTSPDLIFQGSYTTIVEEITASVYERYTQDVTEEAVYKTLQAMINGGALYSNRIGPDMFYLSSKLTVPQFSMPSITLSDLFQEKTTIENKEGGFMVRRFAVITVIEESTDTLEFIYCHSDVPEMTDVDFQKHLLKKLEQYRSTRLELSSSNYHIRIKEIKTTDIEALVLK